MKSYRYELPVDDGSSKIVAVADRDHTVTVSLSLIRGSETMTVTMSDEDAIKFGNNLVQHVKQALGA